ncbi:MAG: putative Ntn-hydrolase superfamily protein [Planctomycetota bacterium]|jgi:uncharacterized Ntn-hydrolase superfamily protein
MPSLRAALTFFVGLLLFAAPASATWSIIIVNLLTGEVAVGIATCLTGFDLRPNTVVIVPGHGAAAAQSFVGPLSLRQLIRDGFLTGESAAQILANLAAADSGHQMRQYGIVSMIGGEVTFTGNQAGAWAGGVVGQVGNFRYAIQGNVLTGQPVIAAAEQAVLNTAGDLPDKLMAAMQAARMMGGDGRCSCSSSSPTACGSPPASFNKSSHIALMIVSRPSDVDLPCGSGSGGCGSGDYWLDLNVANQPASAPDPVVQLQGMFNTWKANQVGRPDHYESLVSMSGTTIRANGVDSVTATVELRDKNGTPLGNALPLTVGLAPNSTVSNVTFSPATAEPNGTYTFTMQGNLNAGVAMLDIAANDAFGRVGVWPRPMVTVLDLFGACGAGAIPDGQGGALPALKVNGSAGEDRVVEVGYAQPFTLTLDPPVGVPNTFPIGLFALWVNNGQPLPGSVLPLSPVGGSMCFTPSLLAPGAPNVLLADSFGLGGLIAATPTPWSLTIPGLPLILDASLQGVMMVDPQATIAATNAVYMRLRPLPVPEIQLISPQSPLVGQTVSVTGSNFFAGMVGRIGTTFVPLLVQSATQLQFPMPAGVPCDSVFEIANPGSALVSASINGTPGITNIPISVGPAAGGSTFYVIGSNMSGSTVLIGGAPMIVSAQTATAIIGTTPPGVAGPAIVTVTNANGCQDVGTFTYL